MVLKQWTPCGQPRGLTGEYAYCFQIKYSQVERRAQIPSSGRCIRALGKAAQLHPAHDQEAKLCHEIPRKQAWLELQKSNSRKWKACPRQ
ncbi:hypothetical protein VZT92_016421 [Zoarces viviparus]|uniref:Uncharacterized protein n=1 Tax=Zoarces viviparus TaxID=48416 RepID=A0AAW1ESQ8_ZOAVI